MVSNAEAGIRRTGIYFVRETLDAQARPVTPADPNWGLYSTTVTSGEPSSSANWEERLGIGNVDPNEKARNQEDHELSVTYDLQRFPVDANGNPQDPFADAALRDADNRLLNSHSFLERELKNDLIAINTLHHKYFVEEGNTHVTGSTASATRKDTRLVRYGRGGVPDEPELQVDPGDTAVIQIELPYVFHKLRHYQLDQPNASRTLWLRSTAAGDTGVSVDLESVDGATTETISLDSADATTAVETVSSFGSLRSAYVDPSQDLQGTLEVYLDDGSGATGTTAEQLLTIVRGANTYDGAASDSGVPLLGAGSFGTGGSLGQTRTAIGRELQWHGDPAAEKIMSTTVTIANNVEDQTTQSGLAKDIRAADRDVTISSSVFGETESYDKGSDHLEGIEGEILLTIQGGDIALPRAYCDEGGDTARESGSAFMSTDVTFRGLQQANGDPAIEFRPA